MINLEEFKEKDPILYAGAICFQEKLNSICFSEESYIPTSENIEYFNIDKKALSYMKDELLLLWIEISNMKNQINSMNEAFIRRDEIIPTYKDLDNLQEGDMFTDECNYVKIK